VAVEVERLRSALLRPGLSELLGDVTNGFITEHDAKLAFAARRRVLPDDHSVEDWRTTNAGSARAAANLMRNVT
jgi:cytochrome c-type biogenesis protein CcmH/NrfG